ncbi:MAG: hypothetical protein DI598_04130 [Pseudopedobacter saltans]|uniref:Uncharacterized protein n=1 Tax=Pseudopedobacter saltans TaxID=151895 RepID=A0A2W5GZ13_9SPHI|nr:MAG: hypothetical protein DI598_04130 [Pseudopedobacter saltans]
MEKKCRNLNSSPQHKNFGPFIQSLANAIISYNSSFPKDLALILAKSGIVDPSQLSDSEKLKNEVEKYSIDGSYKGVDAKYKGNKCKD